MNNPRKVLDMGFTKEQFPDCTHICLFYDQENQRQRIVTEYMAAGLKHGEVVRYFTDVTTPEKIRSWLAEIGVEVSQALEKGAFTIANAETTYCPNGYFDPKDMIARLVPAYDRAKQAGYSGVRSCGEMTWIYKGLPGSTRVLEYEVLLNSITADFPHIGMCMYDVNQFDGATLFKVLQVHPYMVAGGHVVRNPYYIRPDEYQAQA
jgi:hypothetical protein